MSIQPDKLAVVVAVLRNEVLKHYTPDSCIASVKCLIECLANADVIAEPLQVEATISNKIWEDRVARGQHPLHDPKAWAVSLGARDVNADGIAVHVIAWVPALGLIIDPSLDQASRPERGLQAKPVVLSVVERMRKEFLRGHSLMWKRSDDVTLRYRVIDRKDYTTSPNWGRRDRKIRRQIVDAVMAICTGEREVI